MIVLARILLSIAALLGVLTAVAWPPGGLMFALPFFFLFPALILGVVGGIALWIGKHRQYQKASEEDAG